MILSFGNKETLKIWNGDMSMKLPITIQEIARRKLRMLQIREFGRLINTAIKPLREIERLFVRILLN